MNEESVRRLDLNLLRAFCVLMEELNVTRAARRLYIGQPGLSSALRRLREALGDELFIRVGRNMQPTARAKAIAPDISQALGLIDRTLSAPDFFDPSVWDGEFRISMSDHLEMSLIGPLTERIRRHAPCARLVSVPSMASGRARLLDDGACDLSIGLHESPSSWQVREFLFDQHRVCIYDPESLALSSAISVEQYQHAQHVLVSSDHNGDTRSRFLSSAGIPPGNVLVSVSRYSAVAPVLQAMPCIATVPRTVALCLSRLYGFVMCDPPVDFPAEPVSFLYSRADCAHPRQVWLREVSKDVLSAFLGGSGRPGKKGANDHDEE